MSLSDEEFVAAWGKAGGSPSIVARMLGMGERAVAWQQGNPTAPADPHPDALDPYPRRR